MSPSGPIFALCLVALGSVACAGGPRPVTTLLVPPTVRSASASPGRASGSRLAEDALHARGVRFGTDGSPAAIHAFMRHSRRMVPTRDARAGDVLFFDLGPDRGGCGGHLGIVEHVEADGRIVFREARGGSVRRSYAHPGQPGVRRRGERILNTFVRPKHPDDADGARHFAGEALCGVGRAG
jgi:hypothetical protein